MTAASRDLQIPTRRGLQWAYPVKAATKLYGRALVALTSTGFAVPAGTVGAVKIVGVASERVDNSNGTDGEHTVTVLRDVRGFDLAATAANIGATVYAVDDATLSLDSDTGSRQAAGKIIGLSDGLTWVEVGS